jgi:hypothetical protein
MPSVWSTQSVSCCALQVMTTPGWEHSLWTGAHAQCRMAAACPAAAVPGRPGCCGLVVPSALNIVRTACSDERCCRAVGRVAQTTQHNLSVHVIQQLLLLLLLILLLLLLLLLWTCVQGSVRCSCCPGVGPHQPPCTLQAWLPAGC